MDCLQGEYTSRKGQDFSHLKRDQKMDSLQGEHIGRKGLAFSTAKEVKTLNMETPKGGHPMEGQVSSISKIENPGNGFPEGRIHQTMTRRQGWYFPLQQRILTPRRETTQDGRGLFLSMCIYIYIYI